MKIKQLTLPNCDVCRFFQVCGHLALGVAVAREALTAAECHLSHQCHGLMATPSGRVATPKTVATTVFVPVLITETSLEILFET